MGVDVWIPRHTNTVTGAPVDVSSTAAECQQAGDDLVAEIQSCQRCQLATTRTQVVIGRGSSTARWFIIGEAPGAEEDRLGEPFVGPAGRLLDEMLKSIKLTTDDFYIANMVKCRPPGNRNPSLAEVNACGDFLHRQITLISPSIILVLGRIAAQSMLASTESLARLRGHLHQHPQTGIPLIVTYHPAYLLRSPRDKGKSWQDLCLARQTLAQSLC